MLARFATDILADDGRVAIAQRNGLQDGGDQVIHETDIVQFPIVVVGGWRDSDVVVELETAAAIALDKDEIDALLVALVHEETDVLIVRTERAEVDKEGRERQNQVGDIQGDGLLAVENLVEQAGGNGVALRYPLPGLDGAEGLELVEKLVGPTTGHGAGLPQNIAVLLEAVEFGILLNGGDDAEKALGVTQMLAERFALIGDSHGNRIVGREGVGLAKLGVDFVFELLLFSGDGMAFALGTVAMLGCRHRSFTPLLV